MSIEDDGFITVYPPIPYRPPSQEMIEAQINYHRALTEVVTAMQIMLHERIAVASKAYAEDVLRELAKFMATNPGARPVLKTWYDEKMKTMRSEWIATELLNPTQGETT